VSVIVLDAGALVAVDRDDRPMITRLLAARARGDTLRTNAMVVAQVWRGTGGRQANLASALHGVDVRPVDEGAGRSAGQLLGRSGTSDAIDATVVLLARPGDRILTSDPDDLQRLADAAGLPVRVIRC